MQTKLRPFERQWPWPHSQPRDWRLNLFFWWLPGVVLNPVGMLEVPLSFGLGIYYWAHFRSTLLPLTIVVWSLKTGISMCTLHRYFSHIGFKCSRVTQFALFCVACLASQGSPLWWASKHRRHHAYCETEMDPHSPVARSALYAWLGWVYLPGAEGSLGRGVDEEYVQDLMRYPELVLGENFYWLPMCALHAWFYWIGGVGYLVYVSLWSGLLCQWLTLYFNVYAHSGPAVFSWACKAAEGRCKALDLPWYIYVPDVLLGEAHHAWHHVNPRAYQRPGLDLSYYLFIRPCLSAGLFWGPNLTQESMRARS